MGAPLDTKSMDGRKRLRGLQCSGEIVGGSPLPPPSLSHSPSLILLSLLQRSYNLYIRYARSSQDSCIAVCRREQTVIIPTSILFTPFDSIKNQIQLTAL